MRAGDKVKIYTDPLTEERVEGEAELLKDLNLGAEGALEFWRVRFLDDGFEASRLVKRKEDQDES